MSIPIGNVVNNNLKKKKENSVIEQNTRWMGKEEWKGGEVRGVRGKRIRHEGGCGYKAYLLC